MSKLRVHELARELGRQNREVIEFLKSKGVDVRSHMSMVDEPAVSEVKNRFRKDNNNRGKEHIAKLETCLLYTSPSPRDTRSTRMPSTA